MDAAARVGEAGELRCGKLLARVLKDKARRSPQPPLPVPTGATLPSKHNPCAFLCLKHPGGPASVFGSHAYCEARTAVEGAPAPSWSDPRVTTALQRPFPAGSACLERRCAACASAGEGRSVESCPSHQDDQGATRTQEETRGSALDRKTALGTAGGRCQ